MNPHSEAELIVERIYAVNQRIIEAADKVGTVSSNISVMAVTKTVEPERVNVAIEAGITLLGENRVQEFLDKRESYSGKLSNIHFIGHLQSNKVKYIIDKVDMIESADTFSIIEEIALRASQMNVVMPILLQVNISSEESKSGFFLDNVIEVVKRVGGLENISLRGLMCIPEKGNTLEGFKAMEDLFFKVKEAPITNGSMEILSMGMSDDYDKAILHHANLIRLGSVIFGKRV